MGIDNACVVNQLNDWLVRGIDDGHLKRAVIDRPRCVVKVRSGAMA